MSKIWRILFVGVLIVLTVNFAAYISKYYSLNRDDTKLKEVERLIQAVPTYPSSEEVETSSSSKSRAARVGKVYKSDASYHDLRRYYTENLTRLGWSLESERKVKDWWRDLGGRELRFRDGQYYISIEFAGEKANYGWNYGISLGWHGR